jgi:hypothetical protein
MAQRQLPSQGAIIPATGVNPGVPSTQQNIPKVSFWKKFVKVFLIAIIILIIIAVFAVAYVSAATGLVHIPGLSAILYKQPVPSRQVAAESLNPQAIKKRVQSEINQGKDTVEVYLTEGNLTSMIAASNSETKLENPQIVLIDNGKKIEIFGKLSGSELYLTAFYTLDKDSQNNLKIDRLVDFRIGNLTVPNSAISSGIISEESIRNLVGAQALEDALSNEGTGLKISEIEFQEGKILELVSLKSYTDNQKADQNNDQSFGLDANLN